MTDASLYTGSHKERFDKDGKGKGEFVLKFWLSNLNSSITITSVLKGLTI